MNVRRALAWPVRATLGEETAARFEKDRAATTGLALLHAIVLFALIGPLVARWDPDASDFSLVRGGAAPPGPSASHWLGTDPLFRDVLARLAAGARLSLLVAATATLIAMGLGTLVGLLAGWTAGGRMRAVDGALMRLVDVVLAMPFLLLVTAIGVAVGRADVGTLLFVLGLTGWAGTARLVRAKTLSIRQLDFVTAARALGATTPRILARHVLPNVAGPLLVIATTAVGQMILAEAVLGYLTVGIQPPRATWGRMLHEAEPYLGVRLGLVAAPGFAILLTVLATSRVGDGLRDALDARAGAVAPRGRLPIDLLVATVAIALVGFATPRGLAAPLPAGEASSPRRGGTLHVATFVNLRGLDPATAYDDAARAIGDLVFARLVTWDDAGRIVPDLAERVERSTDGRTLTFALREGLVFHDGSPLAAADVARSLERTLDARTPCPLAEAYASIEGFAAFHAGKAAHLDGVRAVSERVVEIRLTEPDATFLPLLTLAFAAPVCASSGDHVDSRNPAPPCGAGPFRVETFEPEQRVRLARHDRYHRSGKPYLDGIEWTLAVRPQAQRYAFEAGRLDWVHDLVGTDAAAYRADPAWLRQSSSTTKLAVNAIFLNTEVPPFDRREVRRAVSLAVDPAVLERVRPDVAAADRVLPDALPGPARDEPMRRHDLAAALDAMRAAGLAYDPATERGGWPEPIDYVAVPDTFEQQAAEIFQQQLAKIGLRVRVRLVSYATYLADVSHRRASPMGWVGWSADFPDASNFFEPTLSAKAIADDGSQNYAFFASPALDRALEAAHREAEPARRDALYLEAERIVRDEAPWIPVYVTRTFEVWQPYVRGYAPHPLLPARFADVWLAREDEP